MKHDIKYGIKYDIRLKKDCFNLLCHTLHECINKIIYSERKHINRQP